MHTLAQNKPGIDQDTLIPRAVFFDNTANNKQHLRLSPDGQKIAYIAPLNGVLNIWVSTKDDMQNPKTVTNDAERGIRAFVWAYTNKHIIYGKDTDGDENTRLYVLDLITGKEQLITPATKVLAGIDKLSDKFPEEILVSLNERNPSFHDTYRLNIITGARELVYENNEFRSLIYDNNFNLRFATKANKEGGTEYFYYHNNQFNLYQVVSYDDSQTTSLIKINKNASNFYLIESYDSNYPVLRKIAFNDLYENGPKAVGNVIFGDQNGQISSTIASNISGDIVGVATTYFKSKWYFLDTKYEQIFKKLEQKLLGEIIVTSSSIDDNYWIIAVNSDTLPVDYYYYDVQSDNLVHLFVSSPELAKYQGQFCKMHSADIIARDGLKLPSYYTLPKEIDINGKAARPINFVLFVHGGPQVRDDWGFIPTVQWLANRGYGVLQINYRGSAGFGKELYKKGAGQWGAKAHDDLLDGVEWLIDNKFATKETIAIFGGSYGGYAALAGLTFSPDTFACAISIVGPSNLETLILSIPPYWAPYLNSLKKRIGADPDTEEGRKFLRSRSPLFAVEKIKKPLLILQGANDPRVKQAESDQIVEAMASHKIPVTYGLFPDEGHGFVKPQNRIAEYCLIEKFLHKLLGGKLEIIKDELKASSIIIKEDGQQLASH